MVYKQHCKQLIIQGQVPHEECHASTVLALPDGNLLAAWFGGTKEGEDDVVIWLSQCKSGTWCPPKAITPNDGVPHWNPVLFRRGEEIVLFYKKAKEIPHWQTMVMTSQDGGDHWSEPMLLMADDVGGRGPCKNKPVVLSDGTWIAPNSREDKIWYAFADLSHDQGRTWQPSMTVPNDFTQAKHGLIQPTLWESAPGMVHMLLRSTEGRIYRSDSADYGRTWCHGYPTDLPNNNSGIDVAKLADGTLFLVYNPVSENWGPRTPLVGIFSYDNGMTWKYHIILEDSEGEYSYPFVITKDNHIYLSYTFKRQNIAFWDIEIQ